MDEFKALPEAVMIIGGHSISTLVYKCETLSYSLSSGITRTLNTSQRSPGL